MTTEATEKLTPTEFLEIIREGFGDDPERVRRAENVSRQIAHYCYDYGGAKYCANALRRLAATLVEAADHMHPERAA